MTEVPASALALGVRTGGTGLAALFLLVAGWGLSRLPAADLGGVVLLLVIPSALVNAACAATAVWLARAAPPRGDGPLVAPLVGCAAAAAAIAALAAMLLGGERGALGPLAAATFVHLAAVAFWALGRGRRAGAA